LCITEVLLARRDVETRKIEDVSSLAKVRTCIPLMGLRGTIIAILVPSALIPVVSTSELEDFITAPSAANSQTLANVAIHDLWRDGTIFKTYVCQYVNHRQFLADLIF